MSGVSRVGGRWTGRALVVLATVLGVTGGVLADSVDAVVTLFDPAGKAVSDAKVIVWKLNLKGERTDWSEQTVAWGHSDTDGRVLLEGLDPEQPYRLEVKAPATRDDLASIDRKDWHAGSETIRMERGWVIRGVVHDRSGKPIPASVKRKRAEGWSSGPTNRDGTFVLRGLPYGPVEIAPGPSPWIRDPPPELEVERWTTVTPDAPNVVLVLRPETEEESRAASRRAEEEARASGQKMVTVTVVGPDGSPAVDGKLAWIGSTSGHHVPLRSGRASLRVEREAATARVFGARDSDGKPLAPGSIRVPAAEREVAVRLAAGLEIAGRVVGQDARGVSGAHLRAELLHDGFVPEMPPLAEATTGEDGTFRLSGLGADEVGVVVDDAPPPHAAGVRAVARGGVSDLQIVLPTAISPDVAVVDGGGAPVLRAHVVLQRLRPAGAGAVIHDPVFDGATDREGRFHLRSVDPTAAYVLHVDPPDDRDDLASLRMDDWTPNAAEPVRMARGFVVSGVVRDGFDQPVIARIIWEAPEDESGWGSVWLAGESDSDGTFRLRGLPFRPLLLAAAPSPGWDLPSPSRSPWVVAATPDKPEVVLHLLGPARDVRVRVEGAGSGWSGTLRSEFEGRDGPQAVALRFSEEGTAPARGVTAGRWTLWVPAPPGETRIAFGAGIEIRTQVEIAVPPREGESVRVRVALLEGNVTSVRVIGPLGVELDAEELGQQRYVVRGLPPGAWEVRVHASLGDRDLVASGRATAGGDELVVEPR